MKILYFLSHPIQYQTPLIQYLIRDGHKIDTCYATDITAKCFRDDDFGVDVDWNMQLLDGYPSTILNPNSPIPTGFKQLNQFRNLIKKRLNASRPNVAWIHGWGNDYLLAAIIECKLAKIPVMIRGETHLGCIRSEGIKRLGHRLLFSFLFSQLAAFFTVGTANARLYEHYNVPAEKMILMPYAVDNSAFQHPLGSMDSTESSLKLSLNIDTATQIILYVGKLIWKKDVLTLVKAFKQIESSYPNIALFIAGDGEERQALQTQQVIQNSKRIRFLGFQSQAELRALYKIATVLVLPSVFEPWGLCVNEVMNASKPVIVSDAVGCHEDLIKPGVNGYVFMKQNTEQLASALVNVVNDADWCKHAGQSSLRIINRWSFSEDSDALTLGIKKIHCY